MSETVGKLVSKQLPYLGLNTSPGPPISRGRGDVIRALKTLGLWDAEIVEGEVWRAYGDTGPDEFFIGKLGTKARRFCFEGETVRIIVLPVEEKEDDSR